MTFWNTVYAVVLGFAIYNIADLLLTEIIRQITLKRNTKKFKTILAELEYAYTEAEKKTARKKAVVKKKAVAKRK